MRLETRATIDIYGFREREGPFAQVKMNRAAKGHLAHQIHRLRMDLVHGTAFGQEVASVLFARKRMYKELVPVPEDPICRLACVNRDRKEDCRRSHRNTATPLKSLMSVVCAKG